MRDAGGDQRDCVDDLVALCSGHERLGVLSVVWDASLAFSQAFGLRMSPDTKCMRRATLALDRAALAARAGPLVQAHFKDLGVDQQAGHRREGRVSVEDVAVAAERLRRCGSMAVGVAGSALLNRT